MRILVKKVLWVGCLGLLLLSSGLVMASGSLRASEPKEKKEKEVMAPDFSLQTVSGKTVALNQLKGKGIILFFFTTWCPYCREKIPMLSKNYSTYQSQNIELVPVNVGESLPKVNAFLAKHEVPFDVLLDSATKVSGAYGVMGVPTFVLISKDGRVVYMDNDLPSNYADQLK